MTNIVAAIAFTLTTNWTTFERVSPVVPNMGPTNLAVIAHERLRQRGQVLRNTVAVMDWNGRKIETVLESADITSSLGEPIVREVIDQSNPFRVPGDWHIRSFPADIRIHNAPTTNALISYL